MPELGDRRSRRRLIAVGIAVLVAVAVAVLPSFWSTLFRGSAPRGEPTLTPSPTATLDTSPPPTAVSLPPGVQDLLARRDRAIVQDDLGTLSALTGTAASSSSMAASQRRLQRNLVALPLDQWQTTVRSWTPEASGQLELRVHVRYRYQGWTDKPWVASRRMTLTRSPAGWSVVADEGTGRYAQPWDVDTITPTQRGSVLLLRMGADSTSLTSSDVVTRTNRAVTEVTTFWGTDWDRRVVAVLPASQAQLASMLRGRTRNYDALAALATTEIYGDDGTAPTPTVWINPSGFQRISGLGRSIVLRHEVLHVATRASVPNRFAVWWEEGVAEYLGYRDTKVPVGIVARDLLAAQRSGRAPLTAPENADFRPGSSSLLVSYEWSWWTVRLLVDQYGEAAVKQVYRRALADPNPDGAINRALPLEIGVSVSQVEQLSRAALRAVARAS
ncbi:MAG TPA: hypothetical protein DHW34_07135 [Actinobacteria bacterium]|nr:hypothetical protein [Actinomycetota bacterium]HCK79771.1 hypothetical protein [Actinomycetota bacterium]